VLQQITLETEDPSFKFSDSSKEILHGLTLKIEQGKELQFTVPMDLEKQHSHFI
jgi:ABC-type transport system involved in cytochrome bd biosynthesis fused ATPase/permease subunit